MTSRKAGHATNCRIGIPKLSTWRITDKSNRLRETNATEHDESKLSRPILLLAQDFSDKISYAFQLATAQGPLCHEPVQGVAVFLEEVVITASNEGGSSERDAVGRLTGEVIKTVRESIRQGFLDWSPRIFLAMYSCEIQASSMSIPSVYDSR